MKQGAEVVSNRLAYLSISELNERLEQIDAARHALADAATELMFPNWEGIGEMLARYDREESALRDMVRDAAPGAVLLNRRGRRRPRLKLLGERSGDRTTEQVVNQDCTSGGARSCPNCGNCTCPRDPPEFKRLCHKDPLTREETKRLMELDFKLTKQIREGSCPLHNGASKHAVLVRK